MNEHGTRFRYVHMRTACFEIFESLGEEMIMITMIISDLVLACHGHDELMRFELGAGEKVKTNNPGYRSSLIAMTFSRCDAIETISDDDIEDDEDNPRGIADKPQKSNKTNSSSF